MGQEAEGKPVSWTWCMSLCILPGDTEASWVSREMEVEQAENWEHHNRATTGYNVQVICETIFHINSGPLGRRGKKKKKL